MVDITIRDVRQILNLIFKNDEKLRRNLELMSSKDLYKVDMSKEFGLDSWGFEDILNELYYNFSINVDIAAMQKSAFAKKPTVENFIETVNDIGYYY